MQKITIRIVIKTGAKDLGKRLPEIESYQRCNCFNFKRNVCVFWICVSKRSRATQPEQTKKT